MTRKDVMLRLFLHRQLLTLRCSLGARGAILTALLHFDEKFGAQVTALVRRLCGVGGV